MNTWLVLSIIFGLVGAGIILHTWFKVEKKEEEFDYRDFDDRR